jgi:uncharacterized integral membrane protein (TIGR00698 family)
MMTTTTNVAGRIATTTAKNAHAARPRAPLGEDWLSVLLGLFLVAVVIAGVRPAWPSSGWSDARELGGVLLGLPNLQKLLVVGIPVFALALLSARAMGANVRRFAIGFPVLFGLAWLAQVLAGHAVVRAWGFEYVIFGLTIGLVISNVFGAPAWLLEAARTEFYIKTGLVLLGTTVVFGDLLQAGFLGIAQGVLVVSVVWFASFWLSRKLRVDDELAVMLASAVSICGVSAAIATCGAIQGDRRKLSYVTTLVLVVAVPMLILMPPLITALGIPDVVGGAWLGGTLDTSAAVVAAGERIGPAARNAGVVVKLSQNVLIGIAAFLLTFWWVMRDHGSARSGPGARVIWQRFPKFVFGFLASSLVFSAWLDAGTVAATKGTLNNLRTVWFALAFTSIGLEARFGELISVDDGRPALAFLGAQAFNVVWTLVLAYLLFGGVFFAVPALDRL